MRRPRRAAVAAVLAAIIAAISVAAGAGTAAAQPMQGQAAPPEVSSSFTSATDPSADGPVVAQADPFTHDAPGLTTGQIELVTLSARPALVSGDAVRIAVRGLLATDPLTLTVDGAPSTAEFSRGTSREAVIRGLTPGNHSLTATSLDRTVTLVVTAHDAQQTLLSGAKQSPLVCDSESGLPAPTGPDCTFPPTVHYWYENVAQQFSQLADPGAAYPLDIATTTAPDGRTVPFVVRVENVVLNDSTTQIAVLDDPHARGSSPFAAAEWNHNVLYHFGEACGTGFHQGTQNESDVFGTATSLSGTNIAGPLLGLPQRLGEGWIVVQSTRTIFGVACNPVLSAETVNDILGHIWTDYGDISHTIGGGGSGGAIQQLTLANDYPGMLDGITPTLEFPDLTSQLQTVLDCTLLTSVFDADRVRWTPLKQDAVSGLQVPTACSDWSSDIGVDFQSGHCPATVSGVSCALQDDLKNIFGTDPATGQPARPVDNVGVEYGLDALEAGSISADDFVALNTSVGGLGLNGQPVTGRSEMSTSEAQRMYALGFINDRGAMNGVPIIDQSIPLFQDAPSADIHDEIRPFETRARLDKNYGGHGNQAVWVGAPLPSAAVVTMQEWLTDLDALQAAKPGMTRAEAIVASRPADAGDQCEVDGVAATQACAQGVLVASGTRQVAGGPLTEDDIKCQLKPFTAVPGLTSLQNATLAAVFPTGVCDYSVPAVGDRGAQTPTWLSFGSGSTLATPVSIDYPIARSAPALTAAVTTPTHQTAQPPVKAVVKARNHRPATSRKTISAPKGTLAYTGLAWQWPVTGLALLGVGLTIRRRGGRPRPPRRSVS